MRAALTATWLPGGGSGVTTAPVAALAPAELPACARASVIADPGVNGRRRPAVFARRP
jgi:hypothetical protein